MSKRELYRAFARLGLQVTAGEELRFWRAIDGDGNGRVDWREFRRAGLALHSLGELTATAPPPPPLYPLSSPAAAAAAAAASLLTSSSTSVASPCASVRSSALSSPRTPPQQAPQHTAFARRDYEEEGRVRGAARSLEALEGRVRRTSVQLMRGAYRRLVRDG